MLSNRPAWAIIYRMIERMRRSWREFRDGTPGYRFQERYRRRQEQGKVHIAVKVLYIVLGTIIAVGSLLLAPLPGPGWGTVFIGLMILAGEFLPAARLLDWAEIRLRKLARLGRAIWDTSSRTERVLMAVGVLAAFVALIYGIYYLLFGG